MFDSLVDIEGLSDNNNNKSIAIRVATTTTAKQKVRVHGRMISCKMKPKAPRFLLKVFNAAEGVVESPSKIQLCPSEE